MQKKNLRVYSEQTCGEHCQTSRRAFSLVELLVVIGIIGILSTVGIISYNGTQKVARDNQRKSDLAAIGTAYKMHYQDKKSWKFDATGELTGINPTATVEGSGGQGWFNCEAPSSNCTSYKVSIANALTKLGYLSKAPRDPLIADDSTLFTSTAAQYMKYLCTYADGSKHGIILFARLETTATPYSIDSDPTLYLCMSGAQTMKTSLNTSYKMNYVIGIK